MYCGNVVVLCLVGLFSFHCCSEGRRIIHFYVPFNESYLLTIPREKNSVGVSFCTDAQIYQNCLSAVKGAWKCEKTEDASKEFLGGEKKGANKVVQPDL